MASEHDLTTEHGLSAYLTSKSIPHTSVVLLTGGTANYVYRVTLASGQTIVYKHAAPYLHSNTSFAFDPSRMDYEDHILELLPPLLSHQLPDSSVHAVRVNSYDRENKLLCLSDGGSRHLKDAYTDPTLNIPQLGQDLGHWLAALHTSTATTSLSLDPTDQTSTANNAVAVSIYRHAYKNLFTAFLAYPYAPPVPAPAHAHTDAIDVPSAAITLAQHINDAFGSRLAHENECLCHGDFWPGNVLVGPSTTATTSPGLTVVDWEMTRRGTSATDTAQFLAEAFLLDRFRARPRTQTQTQTQTQTHTETGPHLAPAFLNAYLAGRTARASQLPAPDREWFRRAAVHWGVHVAYWPTRVAWTDGPGTQALVEIGRAVLEAAAESKWEVLFGGGGNAGLAVFEGMEERFRPEY